MEVTESNEEDPANNLTVRRTGDWKAYKQYFEAAGWLPTGFTDLWAVTHVAAIKAPGLPVKYFTASGSIVSSNQPFLIAMGVTAAVSLLSLGLLVWQISMDVVPRASNGIHQRLLNTISRALLSFFAKTDSGAILNRFIGDLTVIDNELPNVLVGTMLNLHYFPIGGGLMASTASYFLATVPVVFALFVVQTFYLRTSRQMRYLDLDSKAPRYTHFQESLSGLVSIRAFGWVDQFCSRNSERRSKYEDGF